MAKNRRHWAHFGPFLLPMERKSRHWAHRQAKKSPARCETFREAKGARGICPRIKGASGTKIDRLASRSIFRASGGTRTRTDITAQGIFLPLWLSPPLLRHNGASFVVWTIPSP